MNDSSEDFDALRKLLTLKRHEQPPPGFFDKMPQNILPRLQEQSAPQAFPFWRDWFSNFGFKPAVAYGVLMGVCAVILVGVGYAFRMETQPVGALGPDESWRLSASIPDFSEKPVIPSGFTLQAADLSSTNPVFERGESLFGGPKLRVQPASFPWEP